MKDLCILIGCSGTDKNCPGNPNCEILKKIIGAGKIEEPDNERD